MHALALTQTWNCQVLTRSDSWLSLVPRPCSTSLPLVWEWDWSEHTCTVPPANMKVLKQSDSLKGKFDPFRSIENITVFNFLHHHYPEGFTKPWNDSWVKAVKLNVHFQVSQDKVAASECCLCVSTCLCQPCHYFFFIITIGGGYLYTNVVHPGRHFTLG